MLIDILLSFVKISRTIFKLLSLKFQGKYLKKSINARVMVLALCSVCTWSDVDIYLYEV